MRLQNLTNNLIKLFTILIVCVTIKELNNKSLIVCCDIDKIDYTFVTLMPCLYVADKAFFGLLKAIIVQNKRGRKK